MTGVAKQKAEEKTGLRGLTELLDPSLLELANHPTSGPLDI